MTILSQSILIEYAHYDQRFVVFCDSNIAFKLIKKCLHSTNQFSCSRIVSN
ncbi:hypothetical protein pb186bvf_001172 [Paramecium bursaria]